ncbi:hypothetical protein ID866_5851 [Astraeus odoratus]|nr:hypothetical protein ID866_5851 [Astraeus odoratus]
MVDADPSPFGIAKIPFSRILDSKRAAALYISQLAKRDDTVFVQKAYGYYCAYVVTSSTTTFNLVIDTGSGYTWVGAQEHNPYVEGPASIATGIPTEVSYSGDGATFRGETYSDTIGLGALIIQSQGIGVPTEVHGFPAGIDGVLGLGPTRLTAGISSDGGLIPTVVDNLYSQGSIGSPSLGVYFVPENVAAVGLLSFGYIQETVLTSDMTYVPVTTTSPTSSFWGVDASMVYGGNTPILNFGPGLLDTGSTKITIAGDAFAAYRAATGSVLHHSGWLIITQAQYNRLQTLSILIGDQSYDLSPNAQIYARSSPNSPVILVVRSRRASSRSVFSLGAPFFQRYYVVFNSTSNQIGFASHFYTDSTTN